MMLILLFSPLSWYRYDFKYGNSYICFCKIFLYINYLSKSNSNMYPNLNSVISLNQLVIKLQLCSSNNLSSLPLQPINDTFIMLWRCVFFKHYILRAICQFKKFQIVWHLIMIGQTLCYEHNSLSSSIRGKAVLRKIF